MDNLLGLTPPASLSLTALAVNLLLSIALSTVLAWLYRQYGKSLSNRARFAQALPLMAMTTVLIISIVKSSLALSLGLVGALSIVRFRTAIKEPEELLYLFMAIGIGLGMGADQRLPTILAVLIFVGYLLTRVWIAPRRIASNMYLNIAAPSSDDTFVRIRDVLLKHVSSVDLQVTCLLDCPDDEVLARLMDDLRVQVPGCECNFVAQDSALGR